MCVTAPNSIRSVKQFSRYGHFLFFKDGSRPYLGFVKVRILTATTIQRVHVRHPAEFYADRSNHCQDIAILDIL